LVAGNHCTEISNDRDREEAAIRGKKLSNNSKINTKQKNILTKYPLLREDSLVRCRSRYIGRQRSLVGDRSGIQNIHKIKRNSKIVGSIAESKHAWPFKGRKECVWSVKRRCVCRETETEKERMEERETEREERPFSWTGMNEMLVNIHFYSPPTASAQP